MSWARVDDMLWAHPKWERLESEFGPTTHAQAGCLWLYALSYCSARTTNGRIALSKCRTLVPWSPVRAAKALVAVGLWKSVGPQSYAFHDWQDYRPRKEKPTNKQGNNPGKKRTDNRPDNPPDNQTNNHGENHTNNRSVRPAESLAKVPTPDPVPVTPPNGGVEAPPSERFRERWRAAFREHRSNQDPTTMNGWGEAVAWLASEADRQGVELDALMERALAAYWSEDWPKRHRSNPTPRNLLSQLPRLVSQPADDGPRIRKVERRRFVSWVTYDAEGNPTTRWKDEVTGKECDPPPPERRRETYTDEIREVA